LWGENIKCALKRFVSRVLCPLGSLHRGGDHFSGIPIARDLKQPTRSAYYIRGPVRQKRTQGPLMPPSPALALAEPGSLFNFGRAVLWSFGDQAEPIWSCSGWGLPCPRHHWRGGELLPRRFTLARMRSEMAGAPCHLSLTVGGLFSVALSVPSRGLGVTQHPALWSSDFPHPACSCGARSPEPLQYATLLYYCREGYCNCSSFTSGSPPKTAARTRP
jgi:hypothetical protein